MDDKQEIVEHGRDVLHSSTPGDSSNRVADTERQVVVSRGGFMNGGWLSTLIFLSIFFVVSFALGFITSQYIGLLGSSIAESLIQQSKRGQAVQGRDLQDGDKVDVTMPLDAGRTLGDKNAKVTIVVFSDFQCSYCEKFYNETYKKLVDNYIKTGKVKLVYKDFPLSFHPQAENAAQASRCAQEQGKFWEMHDKLFENQQSLSEVNYKKWAGEMGLNTVQFNQCFDTKKYAKAVQQDQKDGLAIGVNGTPTFLINGVALVGSYPYESFKQSIDVHL